MSNTLEYSTIFQTELDKAFEQQATSNWMDANAGQVIYNGGKTIKIPTINMDGLKDYDRSKGYPEGAVELSYQTMDMSMDRGTKFLLDAMDVNETNFVANAGAVSGEFQRTKVVPEIDAYRYSKIYAETESYKKEYTLDAATVYEALLDDIGYVQDIVGDNEPLVVSISGQAATALSKQKEFTKVVSAIDFAAGRINTKVKSIDDTPILKVPSSRMLTAYTFNDGKNSGEEKGGFTAGVSAKQINWIVMPRRAVIAVSKQDNMKIITPELNQTADAWLLGYRRYHDCWIKEHMKEAVRCSVSK